MLDIILDCFGALLLFGQAALFLAIGQIETLSNLQDKQAPLTRP